jgi:tripartite-type tricarboxylate transporter receptor subunit TctC
MKQLRFMFRDPEIRARRAPKDADPRVRAIALRGPLRDRLRVAAQLFVAAQAVFLWPASGNAQSVEDFYKSKPITMLVGSGAGGGYDTYARAFAHYWSNHIPGHPNIIAKNMPAAAGIAAASTLFNSAESDGSVIGAFTNGAAMDPLFGNPAARYDAQKFKWLGSIGKLENVCATWHTSAVKTIAQAQAREVIVAAAGATSNTAIVPKMLNALIGTKFKVIAGYDPGSGLTMAVERGEAEGVCGLSWSTMKASRPHWIKDKLLNVIVQMGLQKLADLPDVPSALDLVTDAGNRQVLELILIRQEAGRPFAAPPGAPADRVAALRQAFEETLKDPEFVESAAKQQLEIEPLTGAEIDKLLAKAYGAPKPIIERAASLVYPSSTKTK